MTTKSEFKNHVDECKKITKRFGTTKKLECAGFILPDGKMINLCKKKHEMTYYSDRTREHWEMIKKVYPEMIIQEGIITYLDRCKAIRIRKTPIRLWAQAVHKPTKKQTEQLVKAVKDADRLHAQRVDPTKEEDEDIYCDTTLNNPRPLDVRRWISKCWR